jgi:hypothetical protein
LPRKKKEPPKHDLVTIGREILKEKKEENIVAVEGFAEGEAVQYYDEGWRFGHICELPIKGLNLGRARVENGVTKRKVWVDGTGLKKV